MVDDGLAGVAHNLNGTPISQAELAAYIGTAFGVILPYRAVSSEDFLADRSAELGPELGAIIAGIYDGIGSGAMNNPSDFQKVARRPHQSWDDYFATIANAL
jgi:NAD(P)H dehydrogenase (quinone)